MWWHPVHHRVISKIGERMAQCRELPVEHGEDTWLSRMEDHIVDAEVAVNDVVSSPGTGTTIRATVPLP